MRRVGESMSCMALRLSQATRHHRHPAQVFGMRTLDYWEDRFAPLPTTIDCVDMRILGRDYARPAFTGPGHIDIRSETDLEFTMYATPSDGLYAVRQVEQARKNRYDASVQFVLIATDYRGTEWHCGWTHPEFKTLPHTNCLLTGRLDSLMTLAKGTWVSPISSIELVFSPHLWVPMNEPMVTVTTVDNVEIDREYAPGRQIVQVLDSELNFFYKRSSDSLWLTAKTTDRLRHPFAENWVCEPLRILLGQRVYPRLVARNFGDGTAHVWLRRSLRQLPALGVVSLLEDNSATMKKEFWQLYSNLLRLIAMDGSSGSPDIKPHPITRFYEELIRAGEGSRWVFSMTLSSVAEGLVRMLTPCNPRAKIDTHLKTLVRQKVIGEEHQHSWTRVRHAVMHGHLVSPWGSEEEDQQINQLIDLVHRLTRRLIQTREDVSCGGSDSPVYRAEESEDTGPENTG